MSDKNLTVVQNAWPALPENVRTALATFAAMMTYPNTPNELRMMLLMGAELLNRLPKVENHAGD